MKETVRLDSVSRTFRVAERVVGFRATMRGLVKRTYREINAISDISFVAGAGEVLGVLGPNGSGKTTTLKCVAGLLTPTAGTVDVLGFTPHERSRDLLSQLSFIMGQRSQLHPDVSVFDSLELRRVIYQLTEQQFRDAKQELVELLGLAEFADAPVRQLSLGQRMRCELAAALLHRPQVVLLDEPTIGLDFEAQSAIRGFVRQYVVNHHACVLLTSHYLADIEALADRVVVLAGGRLAFDGSLAALRRLGSDRQVVTVNHDDGFDLDSVRATVAAESGSGEPAIDAVHTTAGEVRVSVARSKAPAMLAALGSLPGVVGVSLSDPPLEAALSLIYASSTPPGE